MIGQQIFQPGYPIDARPRDRVARLQEKAVGDFEYASARVVARLTGEPVTLQDDGSQDSMPDIRIDYSNRPPAFMEVWTDIDENYAATWALLDLRNRFATVAIVLVAGVIAVGLLAGTVLDPSRLGASRARRTQSVSTLSGGVSILLSSGLWPRWSQLRFWAPSLGG
jgi:hypothetical protein